MQELRHIEEEVDSVLNKSTPQPEYELNLLCETINNALSLYLEIWRREMYAPLLVFVILFYPHKVLGLLI